MPEGPAGWARVAAVTGLLLLGAAPAAQEPGGIALPNLRVLPPDDLYLVDERPDGPLRLKFTTVIWNDGEGPMEVRGDPDAPGAALQVTQYLYDEAGRAHPGPEVGTFDFQHRHGHLHLVDFARYELWSLDAEGRPEQQVAENDKIGFCLMDNRVVAPEAAPPDPVYGGCEAEVQGISTGYGDEYLAQLYEQDIDVTGLPEGRYRLVHEANPGGVLREASLDDNDAGVDLYLGEGTVREASDGAVP